MTSPCSTGSWDGRHLIAATRRAGRALSLERTFARLRCGCGRAMPRRGRRDRESAPPPPRLPSFVLRTLEVEMRAYAPGPWRVCSLRWPCPQPFAAWPRSCARSHRLCYRYPVALLAQAQTGQWYLLCREHHTHSSHSLRPMMIGTIVSGAEPAKIGPCDDEDSCCGGRITQERAQTIAGPSRSRALAREVSVINSRRHRLVVRAPPST